MDESKLTEPGWWRWMSWSAVLLFAGAAIMIGLISSGAFDPKPIGEPGGTWRPGSVTVPAGEKRLDWQAPASPLVDHTWRLQAALLEGEVDSAYGLALGDEEQRLVAAVAPTGYVSLWQEGPDGRQDVIPWSTWPHIARQHGTNEIWLDVENGRLSEVRLNRELLWQGTVSVPGTGVGLWAESFGQPTRIDFSNLEIYVAGPAD